MADEFSVSFGEAISTWLGKQGQGSLREKVAGLRTIYEKGASSTHVDLAAYLAVRAPATFAAVSAVLREVLHLAPEFAPQSLADIGAGPGTASFAAAAHFVSLKSAVMVEADQRFAALAEELAGSLPFAAKVRRQSLLATLEPADLVIAAYVLAELPVEAAVQAALHLWQASTGALVLIEPGTPQGFARIRSCREILLKAGANIIGPCTHDAACPMAGDDWCHFKARLARSREHMHAKGGVVPYEDESYAWLAVGRFPARREEARIMAPPAASKIGINLRLCGASGLREEMIASRDKATYKRAKKLKWGDGFSPTGSGEA